MKILIVTRDKTGQIALWNYKSSLYPDLKMDIAGMWENDCIKGCPITDDIETHVFKAIFGYTPRKATKKLLEYKIT